MGNGVISVLQGRISGARGAAGQTKSSVQQGKPLEADDKGDRHDMEQHSGEWSSAVSAAVWSLPQLYLENGVLHPLGLLISILGPPLASGDYPQGLPMGGPTLQTRLF